MLRFLTGGESHGPAETVIIEGIPAGLVITIDTINKELAKRRTDAGRGGRAAIETDTVEILSGIRHGTTLGSPITLLIRNKDFANWKEKMSPHSLDAKRLTLNAVTKPRPGHADFAGAIKYGFDDVRNVLERASARETVTRVAAGAVFKALLKEFSVEIASHTVQIGSIKVEKDHLFEEIKKVFETDPATRCCEPAIAKQMADLILQARKDKNTLGGVIEIIAHNMPIGLGSHVQWDRKLDGQIAQALMSIPSVKAVEIGDGITNATKHGNEVHDEISPLVPPSDEREAHIGGVTRTTNRAGGIEGGISNGQDIVCRVFHKPLSTLMKPLQTVDLATGQKAAAHVERSDVCVVPRAGVISESMLAFVLARELLIKYGGDSIKEMKRNFQF